MPNPAKPTFDRNIWAAESVRFTFFPHEVKSDAIADVAPWWISVANVEPETVTSERKTGVHRISGVTDNEQVQLDLAAHITRLDWIISLSQPFAEAEDPPVPPRLAPATDAVSDLRNRLNAWLGTVDLPVWRLALGVQTITRVGSKDDGYELLNQLLPYVEVDGDSTDFIFQVNRPRRISIGNTDVVINRLTKWHLKGFQKMRLTIPSGGAADHREAVGEATYYCASQIDINTAPNQIDVIDRDLIGETLDRMVDFTFEILEHGDCK